MRIAMIGLGDIAAKAYLPALAAMGHEPVLCTRDAATLAATGDAYRIPGRFTSVPALIASGVDAALVHAATPAHFEIVTQLLEAAIPTYVDKPLSYRLAESAALVETARSRGVSLMVGFNRRYAPGYAALLDRPRDLIVMGKNRAAPAKDPRVAVYDDFIHVVDTLRFLVPGEVTITEIRKRVVGGVLEHVTLELSGADFTAYGLSSRTSGMDDESCEIMGGGHKRTVLNLGDVIDHDGGETLTRRPPWVPVARQRGLEQIVAAFLASVRDGERLDAGDALITHELCERIVTAQG